MDSEQVSLPLIHQDQDSLGLPRLININRHNHRISHASLLGVESSMCGVCHQKVDYSCQSCPGYVVHSNCAIRKDVWNGKELEGIPEEPEDTEAYVIIDDNTIQHFSHKEHHLRLNVNGIQWEDNKRCNACIHPICLQAFYECKNCEFILHQNCAELPTKKWHALHNEQLTLVTSEADLFRCDACSRLSNGFRYQHGDKKFDLLCSSISEPFVHPSHPHRSLYYTPENKSERCDGCGNWRPHGLRCIDDDCSFAILLWNDLCDIQNQWVNFYRKL